MVPADSRPVSRVGRYSGSPPEAWAFRLRGYHSLRRSFPAASTTLRLGNSVAVGRTACGSHDPDAAKPAAWHSIGLGSFLFARRYWGSRGFFLFLQVLRCISSLRSLRRTMDSCDGHGGLPHVVSESRTFPDQRLLAAPRDFSQLSHVLRRLLVPRHPHVHLM